MVIFAFAAFTLWGSDILVPGRFVTAQDIDLSGVGHPRLLFHASDIPVLRERAQTTHHSIWMPIARYVDSMVGQPPPASGTGGDLEFYRTNGDRASTLAFACVIADSDNYCQLAKDYLLAFASWEQWGDNNTRGLGLAHMLAGNALAYDWLYDRLTEAEREQVRASLSRWASAMYDAATQDYDDVWSNWWRKSYMQNHFWVTSSALGLAGLALADEPTICTVTAPQDVNRRSGPGTEHTVIGRLATGETMTVTDQAVGSEGLIWWLLDDGSWVRSDVVMASNGCTSTQSDADAWVERAIDNMAIAQYLLYGIADGSWHESITYQSYLLATSLPFLISLKDLQQLDLFPHEYLRNYTYWRLYNYLPGTIHHFLGYGDFERVWGNSRMPQHILRFAANEYNDGRAEWLAQQLIEADGRNAVQASMPWYVYEFLYYNAQIAPQPPYGLPLARVFPDFEGVIWRTGWENHDLVWGLKTGAYGGRFAHDTFVAGEYPWEQPCSVTACSLNVDHDHRDANTFYLYRAGSWLARENEGVGNYDAAYHNTILIDGLGQYYPPANRFGEYPEDFEGSDGYLQATASTTNFDYVAADATGRYRHIPGIEDNTRHVVFVRPDYFVMLDRLEADAPHHYQWISHFETAVTVEGEWIRGAAQDNQILGVGMASAQPTNVSIGDDGKPFVSVSPDELTDDLRFVHVLYPTYSTMWDNRPDISLIEDSGEAAVLAVNWNDGRTDNIIINYQEPAAPVGAGSYAFDGQIAVVRFGPDCTLQKLFVYGGTSLLKFATATPRCPAGFEQVRDHILVGDLNPVMPFEASYNGHAVAVEGTFDDDITLYAPGIQLLTVNGVVHPFVRTGDYIRFSDQQ